MFIRKAKIHATKIIFVRES